MVRRSLPPKATRSKPRWAGVMRYCSRRAVSYCSKAGMRTPIPASTLLMYAPSARRCRCLTSRWPMPIPSSPGWMGSWCITTTVANKLASGFHQKKKAKAASTSRGGDGKPHGPDKCGKEGHYHDGSHDKPWKPNVHYRWGGRQ